MEVVGALGSCRIGPVPTAAFCYPGRAGVDPLVGATTGVRSAVNGQEEVSFERTAGGLGRRSSHSDFALTLYHSDIK